MSTAQPSSPGLADTLINLIWPKPAPDLGERTRRRVIIYLIPYLFFLYILAYLDRVNVSVAALGMEQTLADGGLGFKEPALHREEALKQLSEKERADPKLVEKKTEEIAQEYANKVIGFGAGVFFWGYWILEIPSTLSVLRWGARYVFVRILLLWGLSCMLIGVAGMAWSRQVFAWIPPMFDFLLALPGGDFLLGWIPGIRAVTYSDPTTAALATEVRFDILQFYFFRFMLGLFEGGFFPSVILYLSLWFRPQDRGRAIATFMAAIPVAQIVGYPLSGVMLNIDWLGMAGWRWIYLLQGLVPMIAGFVTLFFLPDRPSSAKWLPADEKDWLVNELQKEHDSHKGHGHLDWMNQAGIVLLLTIYYFGMNITSYGLSIFLPKIIKSQSGFTDSWASILAGAPNIFALIAMLINGWHSDRTRERIGHVVVPLIGLSVSIFLAALLQNWSWVPVAIMILGVGTCLYSHLPAFWPIPSIFLGAAGAASAIGFINMIGNLGGFVGPHFVGQYAKSDDFTPALYLLSVCPLVSVAMILIVGWIRRDRLAALRKT